MNREEFSKVVFRVLLDLAEHNETRASAGERIEAAAWELVEAETKENN